jgi:GTP-binding protein YchF
VDIAGLVKGAANGEGLGNKFLEHIRQVDAVAHVVRCFDDANITHVEGGVDPLRDIDIIQTELCLADLEVVEKRIMRLAKIAKSGNKEAKVEDEILRRIKESLDNGKPARQVELTADELEMIKDINLLTLKPTLYVTNVAEDEVATAYEENAYVQKVKEFAKAENAEVVAISARVEAEIAELDAEEAKAFLEDLGETESGLDRLIKAAFDLLGLQTFLTAGPDECRAWTITKGTTAPKAAGKIHTDFERGFIRAEIVNYDDLVANGSVAAAREKGQVRVEGKDYVMQDGDVVNFRFNV